MAADDSIPKTRVCATLEDLLRFTDRSMRDSFRTADVWGSGIGSHGEPSAHDLEMQSMMRVVGAAHNTTRNRVEGKMEEFGCPVPPELAVAGKPRPTGTDAYRSLTYRHGRRASQRRRDAGVPLTREYVEERIHTGPEGEHREIVRGIESEPVETVTPGVPAHTYPFVDAERHWNTLDLAGREALLRRIGQNPADYTDLGMDYGGLDGDATDAIEGMMEIGNQRSHGHGSDVEALNRAEAGASKTRRARRGGTRGVQAYMNEEVVYGGRVTTRGEMIRDLDRTAAAQFPGDVERQRQMVGAYMMARSTRDMLDKQRAASDDDDIVEAWGERMPRARALRIADSYGEPGSISARARVLALPRIE